MLRADRTALILTVGTIAVVFTAVGTALSQFFHIPAAQKLLFLSMLAVSAAVVVLFGSGTAWMSYTIARLWLALWGQLPWRLTRFLRHAHTAGVLRQVGPAYQFRHEVLRAYLAHHGPPSRRSGLIVQLANPAQPRPSFLRRWIWWRRLVGVGLALAILPATALFIVPTPLRASLYDSGLYYDLAFSPDGSILATASTDGLKLWDPMTGQLRRTLATNASGVCCVAFNVAFSPDGTTIAAASDDGLRLWDPMTGQVRRTLATNASGGCCAFSPDGTTIVAADDDGLRLWDPMTGQVRHTLTTTSANWNELAFPNGTTLAVLDGDGVLQLWNPATGALRRTVTADGEDGLKSTAFSPDGSFLATATGNGGVRLWDVMTGQLRRTLTNNASGVCCLTFNPDGTTLAASYGDRDEGALQLWNSATGALRHSNTDDHDTLSMAFSPDGLTLITGEDDHVYLRDPVTGQPRHSFQAETEGVTSVGFNADGSTLATVGSSGVVRLWNVAMLQQRQP